MKVAIAYDNGKIYMHFGHAKMFAIYEYGAGLQDCTKRLIETTELHGHVAMAELMKKEKVDAVMSGSMGAEAKALLLSYGIVPVAGFQGDADTAADLLVTGQLPIDPDGGACGGGCGGCGGSCHHDENGACDCGCSGCGD